jgi:hypothetical protein
MMRSSEASSNVFFEFDKDMPESHDDTDIKGVLFARESFRSSKYRLGFSETFDKLELEVSFEEFFVLFIMAHPESSVIIIELG